MLFEVAKAVLQIWLSLQTNVSLWNAHRLYYRCSQQTSKPTTHAKHFPATVVALTH